LEGDGGSAGIVGVLGDDRVQALAVGFLGGAICMYGDQRLDSKSQTKRWPAEK
jgi:hypothetical protein